MVFDVKKVTFDTVNNIHIPIFPIQSEKLPLEKKFLIADANKDIGFLIIKMLKLTFEKNNGELLNCTEKLNIPSLIFIDKKTREITTQGPEALAIQLSEVAVTTKKLYDMYSIGNIKETSNHPFYKTRMDRIDTNLANITKIQNEFEDCEHFQYFVSLNTFSLHSNASHESLLVFNKERKVVTFVDPDYDESLKRVFPLIKDAIKKILDIVHPYSNSSDHLYGYTIDFPNKPCPQAITKDKDCTFWTILLAFVLIINKNATIDEVSAAIQKKYPTKEKLDEYINSAQHMIYELYLLEGGRRSKTYRKLKKNRRSTRKQVKK